MYRQTKVTKTVLIALISFFTFYFTVQAGGASTEDLSKQIPSRCLFCIRVNNLNETLTQIDQFLAGASPVGVSILAKTQIMRILGSPQLAGVNMDGSFAVFGVMPAAQNSQENPASNMAIGILIPVTDYKQFIAGVSNFSQPDDKGIAKITQNGDTVTLVTQAGKYALIAPPGNYDQLVAIKTEILSANSTGIGSTLNVEQLMQSTSSPIWVYGNMQQVAQTFGPMISAGMAQIKEAMTTIGANDVNMPTANIQAIAGMYTDIIDSFVNQSQSVSLTVNPQPAVLNFTSTLRALPQTDMATMFTSSGASAPKNDKLLPYLENGAAANYQINLNSPFWKHIQDDSIELMSAMSKGMVDPAVITKFKSISDQALEALDGPIAYSVTIMPNTKPAFAIKYAAAVKDEGKFSKLVQDGMTLFNTSGISDFYKKMGMEMTFSTNKTAESYKNVTVNSGKFVMKSTDTGSMQAQMIQSMYGDGFDVRWVVTNGLFLSATGGNSDSVIRELIDLAKSPSSQAGSEVNKALSLLPGANQADFFINFNLLRLFQMATAMVPFLPLPQTQFQTSSNVTAIGKAADGQLVINVAVPKEHIQEIMTAVLSIQQQMMQQPTQPSPGSVSPTPFVQ
jgi:hypothetical protein